MPIIPIDSLDDPRVALYRNLKDRELERRGRHFIAEGEHLTRRLLASDFPVDSVMLAERRVAEMAAIVPDHIPVYVTSQDLMNQILGLKFHSGVLACGRRKQRQTIDQVVPRNAEHLTLVICPEISNVENIGTMLRIAAGFGADAMILGERCHDPFWRQSVRVSMGTIFRLPLVQSDDLQRDLRRLRQEWGVQLIAAVLDETAEPLASAQSGKRLGILFGSEAQGLGPQWVDSCDRRVTIPMKHGTDSLNVAVAAGIFLYHFTSGMSDQRGVDAS
ncbi:MAG TPA: RNA methyltransferase [Tepidisphaeraceae bacterium]|nr:RNA methyltransferase [Tepidisphaeraceae bacterium]